MSASWRGLDLGGGGLQSANLRLAQALKRKSGAYWRLAAFPLGLHRAHLDDPRGAWAYRAATAAAVAAAFLDWRAGAAIALLLAAAALYDLYWIDRRVVALNKAIRRRIYLSQGAAPPPGYRGRELGERPAAARAPSFAEQERVLRALATDTARERGARTTEND